MTPTIVILLSDKRSGSTLFEKELCKHTGIQHVVYTPHSYNETHYWVNAACILRTPLDQFSGGVRPRSYGSRKAARKLLVDLVQTNVPDFSAPDSDEALIFGGWRALCDRYAQPVFFEKSPHHPHHPAALRLLLDWINSTEYRVKVIGMVRNPMAVMYSALKLFNTDPTKRQFSWLSANQNILKLGEELGGDRFTLVRYENMVCAPRTFFSEICKFINVDLQESMGQSVNNRSMKKWIEDPFFTMQFDPKVIEFAKKLGYSDEELFIPPKPSQGVFRKSASEIALALKRIWSSIYDAYKRLAR